MALIKCTECGKEISDKAAACPHCGCPTAEMNVRQSEATVGGTADASIANKSTTENSGNHKHKTTKKAINKKIVIPVLALGCAIILFAILVFTHTICLKHSYSEATVLQPQTCYHCGKTKGDPKDLTEIEFPTRGVGALLPIPKSNMGEINWNEASGFNAYVGNTTEEDFNDYIKACIECGFDVDYQKGDDYYYADDINGNNLNVWFKGNNFMEIQIIAPNLEETDADFLSRIEKSVLERMVVMEKGSYDRNAAVIAELNHIQPFEGKEFSDAKLKELALKYLEGLNLQKEASSAEFEYEEPISWQRGIVICCEVLTDLYDKYDFLKDNEGFVGTYISSYEEQQAILTAYESIDEDLSSQVSDDMDGDYDGTNLNFSFQNNTEYTFSTLWKITYFDAKETVVGTESTVVDNIKAGNEYTVSFYVPYPDITDHFTFTGYYTEVKLVENDHDEDFVAQGETMLMNFLDNASDNGYEIVDPQRDGSYVNAKAKKGNVVFDIQYMVENQKVYMVEIKMNVNGETSSEYKDCIIGMAKSLNADIETSVLNNAIDAAFNNPGNRVIKSETLFLFNESKGVFTITH